MLRVLHAQQVFDAQRVGLRARQRGVKRHAVVAGRLAGQQRHALRQHALGAGQVDQLGIGGTPALTLPGAPAGAGQQQRDGQQRGMQSPAQSLVR